MKTAIGQQIIRSLKLVAGNFVILRIKNIRIYMSGQGISLLGTWMQLTAQSWVVWQLSHSTVALGVIALLSQFPSFLLGPWVGAIADRYDRRKILLITQSFSMILAFILAFLVQVHMLMLWHVYLLALFLGIVSAFDLTTQQAFIGEIAGKEQVQKTVALNNSFQQLARFVGPALAGWVLGSLGIAAAFWINGVSFIAVLASLIAIHTMKRNIKPEAANGLSQYRASIQYIQRNRLLLLIILITATQTFFGLSTVQLLPAVVSIILKGNASSLGLILGAAGAGALCGTLFVVPFTQRIAKKCVVLVIAVMWAGAWYIVLSLSHNLALSMLSQFMASLGASNVLVIGNGTLQLVAPEHMRARILSTFIMISLGLQPIASLLIGYFAEIFGVSHIVFFDGCMLIVIPSFILWGAPVLREFRSRLKTEKETAILSPKPMVIGGQ